MKLKGEMLMKKRKQIQNIWLLACLSGVCCLGITVLLSLPAAKLLENGSLPMQAVQPTAYIILGLSAAAGAVFTSLKGKQKILLLCLVTATVCFLSVAILNGALQKGQFNRVGQTALIIYAVSTAAGLLCAKGKRRY